MILAAIMGVVLGVLLVYIKVATDNSLTEKEVLEEIVGADLLSYLEKQEVK